MSLKSLGVSLGLPEPFTYPYLLRKQGNLGYLRSRAQLVVLIWIFLDQGFLRY